MIRIRELSMAPGYDPEELTRQAARLLRIRPEEIRAVSLVRRSVDARKKSDVRIVCTVDADVGGNETAVLRRARCAQASCAEDPVYTVPSCSALTHRPVVVGFGPAGMFCALVLALAGARPIVLERGGDAETRRAAVGTFWRGGALDTECNVQFGEGGAGTFSDGKLNTGVKNTRIRWVLEQFAAAGAPREILTDAKPHIGTDVLPDVVRRIRQRIVALGGEVLFHTKLTALETSGSLLTGVRALREGEPVRFPARFAALAIGHSARDTFEILRDQGVSLVPKPFSMGVRIEHLQPRIDLAQYGAFAGHPDLGPADYRLSVHLPDGTSAYTFCMCPGGQVIAAASEAGGVVTNGMSNRLRDGKNANSALLVTLSPADFPDDSALAGMQWQRQLEQAAFRLGGGDYRAPAQLVGDFLARRASEQLGSVLPTYQPGVTLTDLHALLPPRISDVLANALPALGRKLAGFDAPDAVLTGPETRSSSPVRIVRGEDGQSVSLSGLFPCGEGAGYAGGIMSAAVDGMLTAEAILRQASGMTGL